MAKKKEASIVINGRILTKGERMTVNVALNAYEWHLMDDGLGEDQMGKDLAALYLQNIKEITKYIRN